MQDDLSLAPQGVNLLDARLPFIVALWLVTSRVDHEDDPRRCVALEDVDDVLLRRLKASEVGELLKLLEERERIAPALVASLEAGLGHLRNVRVDPRLIGRGPEVEDGLEGPLPVLVVVLQERVAPVVDVGAAHERHDHSDRSILLHASHVELQRPLPGEVPRAIPIEDLGLFDLRRGGDSGRGRSCEAFGDLLVDVGLRSRVDLWRARSCCASSLG